MAENDEDLRLLLTGKLTPANDTWAFMAGLQFLGLLAIIGGVVLWSTSGVASSQERDLTKHPGLLKLVQSSSSESVLFGKILIVAGGVGLLLSAIPLLVGLRLNRAKRAIAWIKTRDGVDGLQRQLVEVGKKGGEGASSS